MPEYKFHIRKNHLKNERITKITTQRKKKKKENDFEYSMS